MLTSSAARALLAVMLAISECFRGGNNTADAIVVSASKQSHGYYKVEGKVR